MKNQKDCYVISIESRKGGVGKTTVAKNLARYLKEQKKDYEILLIDLDITGTVYPSSAEEHRVPNYFLSAETKKDDDKEKDEHLDILDLFEYYMSGKNIPSPKWIHSDETIKKTESTKNIIFKLGMVNVISSWLKRESCDKANEKKYKYVPAVLFDEIHSAWFITMIQDLIKKCIDSLRKENKKLIVLLDNSPGYSTFQPVIEKWLTDIGPECGKFLFVCSLDEHDITECLKAIKEIHYIYSSKWSASRTLIKELAKTKSGYKDDDYIKVKEFVELDKKEIEFFNRLVELMPKNYDKCEYSENPTKKHHTCTKCGFCFYRVKNTDGDTFIKKPSKYIAMVVNKVPLTIINNEYTYDFQDILKSIGLIKENIEECLSFDRLYELIENNKENNFVDVLNYLLPPPPDEKNSLILYSDKISYQFFACLPKANTSNVMPIVNIEKSQKEKLYYYDLTKLDFKSVAYNLDGTIKNILREIVDIGLKDIERFWSIDFYFISPFIQFLKELLSLSQTVSKSRLTFLETFVDIATELSMDIAAFEKIVETENLKPEEKIVIEKIIRLRGSKIIKEKIELILKNDYIIKENSELIRDLIKTLQSPVVAEISNKQTFIFNNLSIMINNIYVGVNIITKAIITEDLISDSDDKTKDPYTLEDYQSIFSTIMTILLNLATIMYLETESIYENTSKIRTDFSVEQITNAFENFLRNILDTNMLTMIISLTLSTLKNIINFDKIQKLLSYTIEMSKILFLMDVVNKVTDFEKTENYNILNVTLNKLKEINIVISQDDALKLYKHYSLLKKRFTSTKEDFDFLISCFKAIVSVSDKRLPASYIDYLRGLTQDIVVNKTISYESAYNFLNNFTAIEEKEDIKDFTKMELTKDDVKNFDKTFDSFVIASNRWSI